MIDGVRVAETRSGGRLGRHDFLVVFDIGGTTVRAGLYDAKKDRLVAGTARSAEAVRGPGDAPRRLAAFLNELKRSLVDGREVRGAVVGFPGPISPDGLVLAAPTLWPGRTVEPFALGALLEDRWPGLPVVLLNDVTAVGHAYVTPTRKDFCIVTMSSGVGHKIFIDGRAAVGATGAGGEIGHIVVKHGGERVHCDCGGIDHLGAISSGRGILRSARNRAAAAPVDFARSELGRATRGVAAEITNEVVARSYRSGDAWTSEVVHTGVEPLGWLLAVLRSAVGIDEFLIVGGFADALGPRLCADLARAASGSSWDLGADWNQMIAPGALGAAAGLLGAGKFGAGVLHAQ